MSQSNGDSGGNFQRALADFKIHLEALKLLRPPQQDIPNFVLPSHEAVDQWLAAIDISSRDNIVDVVTEIASKLQIPDLEEDPHYSQLTISHSLNRAKNSADRVISGALAQGYPGRHSIIVSRDDINKELIEINKQLTKMGSMMDSLREQAQLAPLSNVAFNIGPIGIPVEVVRMAIARGAALAKEAISVNVSAIALVLAQIGSDSAKILAEIKAQAPAVPRPIAKVAEQAARMGADLAEKGASLLKKVVAKLNTQTVGVATQNGRRTTGRALADPTQDIGIDIGDAATRLYVKGVGLALEAPTITAVRSIRGERRVEAFGYEARVAINSAPSNSRGVPAYKIWMRRGRRCRGPILESPHEGSSSV